MKNIGVLCKIRMGFHGSFMDTFTGIPKCVSCKFKWVFMAIVLLVLSIKNIGYIMQNLMGLHGDFFIGFEHQEYWSS